MATIIEAVGVVGRKSRFRRAGSVELAVRAAEKAIDLAGCDSSEIGFLINAGIYRDQNICEPAMAHFIQRRLGINPICVPGGPSTFSFDLRNGGCGLLAGLQVLDGFLCSGRAKRALVVTSDIDPTPRVSQGFAFDPIGGAVLLRAAPGRAGFSGFHSETIGKHSNLYEGCVEWKERKLSRGRRGRHRGRHVARIRQGEDFVRQAADCAATAVRRFLDARELCCEDLDLLVPSVSPPGFARAFGDRMELSDRAVLAPLEATEVPHTAGPAVALAAAMATERFRTARTTLLVAVGAGITVSLALYVAERGRGLHAQETLR